MLDLKIYDEDQYDLVPVPLPGRLMIFAGPTGLMCRRNDGTIVAYPETTGGGGGAVEFLTMPLHDGGSDFKDWPEPPAGNFMRVFATPGGLALMDPDGQRATLQMDGERMAYLRLADLGQYTYMPNLGNAGEATFGLVNGELVKQLPSGEVVGLDNSARWAPWGGGGGA